MGRDLLRGKILIKLFKTRCFEKLPPINEVKMKRDPKPASFICALLLFFLFSPAWGQESRPNFDVSHSVDWTRREVFSQVSFDLARSGIRLPTGRFMAEEMLREAYPRLIRTFLLSIRLDSSSTVGDMLNRGEITLAELDAVSLAARQIPPSLSPDFTRMNGRYTVFVEQLSTLFIRHRRASEPARPFIPVPTANYTGIIIIADTELPIQGRMTPAMLEPGLFPRIWDTEMNLIYDRNMFDPVIGRERLMVSYAVSESIFRPTPSGLDGELAVLLGPNPLRIIANGGFGINPTDPIIDRQDALRILSSENNRRLLREGRVLFVLSEEMLK